MNKRTSVDMVDDKDLEFLTAKKMRDLRRRIVASDKPIEKNSRDIVTSRIVDRGIEVLELAERYYPNQTSIIIENLANVIKKGELKGSISGGELLGLFRQMGFRISVETSIQVKKDGKLVPLAEKLKKED
ncbi:double-stranded DNA-binding protein [Thermoproteota archaeon]